MKSLLRIALLSACCVALVGCKPVKKATNNLFNSGTVEGVSQCIELSALELVSEETIKSSCVAKFEDRLFGITAQNVTGNGGPRELNGRGFFAGTITNNSGDHVVTEIVVEVTFSRSDVADTKRYKATISGWFEPNGNPTQFSSRDVMDAPDDWGALESCVDDASENCWSWQIEAIKGLEL